MMHRLPMFNDDGTCTIPLTRGKAATIDSDDYLRVAGYQWRANKARGGHIYYAMANLPRREGRRSCVLLHRIVANAPDEVEIDHIDGDGLNCRRNNLRRATRQQNACNRRRRRNFASRFKGVLRAETRNRWIAKIRANNRAYYLGTFDSQEEAARAYSDAAIELHGEFAQSSSPPEGIGAP